MSSDLKRPRQKPARFVSELGSFFTSAKHVGLLCTAHPYYLGPGFSNGRRDDDRPTSDTRLPQIRCRRAKRISVNGACC